MSDVIGLVERGHHCFQHSVERCDSEAIVPDSSQAAVLVPKRRTYDHIRIQCLMEEAQWLRGRGLTVPQVSSCNMEVLNRGVTA